MRARGERAKVLVTVKASPPQPSAKYGDTVCVAGLRIDDGVPPAGFASTCTVPMARLWSQFREYDLVEVDVRRAEGDSRPESFKPDIDSLERVGHVDGWANRQRYFEQLPRTTTCELRAAVAASHAASSLGMIKVAEAVRLEFEVHPGWSDVEKRKIEAAALLPSNTLFGAPAAIPGTLKHPRFKVRYRYHCQAPDCRGGHEGQILDWELTALQNRLARESDAVLKDAIQQRFALGMFGPNRHTSFFMGNFEDPKKRQNFSVLGGSLPFGGSREFADPVRARRGRVKTRLPR